MQERSRFRSLFRRAIGDGPSPDGASSGEGPSALDLAWLTKRQQSAAAGLLTLAAIGVAVVWAFRGGLRGHLVEIDRASPIACKPSIDLNGSTWSELAVLPGISETMARRIVATRDRLGRFQRLADLGLVPGIGPKTIARLREFVYLDSDWDRPPSSTAPDS
jgi:competence protein ComEA